MDKRDTWWSSERREEKIREGKGKWMRIRLRFRLRLRLVDFHSISLNFTHSLTFSLSLSLVDACTGEIANWRQFNYIHLFQLLAVNSWYSYPDTKRNWVELGRWFELPAARWTSKKYSMRLMVVVVFLWLKCNNHYVRYVTNCGPISLVTRKWNLYRATDTHTN